ncbi:DUF1801 domain-containing protein [Solitalea sp. MAHUQ-68]|uniref:DUF1801 domain-containing protein n=1 Tax=Solitalea agri TaxID=2953739 RepID=A0A9X2JE90_9SPHI|nr:DUF1801 domain-containing protein [Solitalea agri]MCO4293710.1 DUF1801 domain-containing protein [Solitalea agri]
MQTIKPGTIDEYIANFPLETQRVLEQIRNTIKNVVPEADEKISYAIPTFYLNGNLIHFAAYANHIGLYPAPRAIEVFKEELSGYKGGKGTIQFPLDKPMPLELIERIVKFRVEESLLKSLKKKK